MIQILHTFLYTVFTCSSSYWRGTVYFPILLCLTICLTCLVNKMSQRVFLFIPLFTFSLSKKHTSAISLVCEYSCEVGTELPQLTDLYYNRAALGIVAWSRIHLIYTCMSIVSDVLGLFVTQYGCNSKWSHLEMYGGVTRGGFVAKKACEEEFFEGGCKNYLGPGSNP